jgi:hypothetical protein
MVSKDDQVELANAEDATYFSQLTYLLTLITSLNADKLCDPSFKRVVVPCNDMDAREEFTVLESIAAILVQNHEVMAACYTADRVSVIAAENETVPSSDIGDIDVDSHVPVQSESSFHKLSSCHPLRLAVPSSDIGDINVDGHVPVQSESSSHNFCHPLRLAAISNPDVSRNSDASEESEDNKHNVRIDDKGKDLCKEIRDSDGWYFVFM